MSDTPLSLRLVRRLSALDITTAHSTYLFRSLLAAWLALVTAYQLQLESPWSAASTVLLVINPIQGAVIGKGSWRILGTLLGMVVSVLLLAFFAQQPWFFLTGFSLWLGFAVAGMTLLRHFRASGMVVAGYTVGLATYGALQHPELTFEQVIARGSTVVVGVVSLGIVTALFSRRSITAKVDKQLAHLTQACFEAISLSSTEEFSSRRRHLLADLYAMDDLLAVGKAESAVLAARARALRYWVSSLSAALTAPASQAHDWAQIHQLICQGNHGLVSALHRLKPGRDHHQDAQSYACYQALRCLAHDKKLQRHRIVPAISFHRDSRMAMINGSRAALTLFCGGAVWLLSGWSNGDTMLLILAPYCSLLALSPAPAIGAKGFVKGTLYAIPLAAVCAFAILPAIHDLPLLLLVLGLFWTPGILATTQPRNMLAGLGYLVGFNTLVAAGNPMQFDGNDFLNQSVAWLLASCFTLLSFRVLWPPNAPRQLARLLRTIQAAALQPGHSPRHLWRQQHRLALLAAMTRAHPDVSHPVDGSLPLLQQQQLILQLQQHIRDDHRHSITLQRALKRMRQRHHQPVRAAQPLRHAAWLIRRQDNPHDHALIAQLNLLAKLLTDQGDKNAK
ncbi:FUSC family protein [Candidatus Pantoea multigeneris]|uniref:FUSC family protein n=1 Tax=Candidatus Pantoea multigeneris TaxID=2608357 RepID=A0ABX0RA23_9GAMM|nr:FUSC family protein [Pantoea multigeneris]NIF22215.1 FUSC family protein [Pantoea multigeneris]